MIVDLFAGGGGASLGIEWALGCSPDVAVNHDPLLNGKPLSKTVQIEKVGNSVSPNMSYALAAANISQALRAVA